MSRSRLAHALEYSAVAGTAAALGALPHSTALRVGAALGSAAFRVLRVRREVTESNIAAAFGWPRGGDAVTAVGHDCYRNLGMTMAELARLPRLGRAGLSRLVTVDGLEHFDRALCEGKGAVLATGHFGNWELMGAALAQRGYPMNFLVGHQTNRMVDGALNSLRSRFGIGIVRHGVHVREALRLLDRNQFVAMLCDHDAGRKGIMIRFFGMPASSALGPASLALQAAAPIIMGFISRAPGGRHRVELTAPIHVRTDVDPALAIGETTQRLADVIEEHVRRRPDHWYWVHRRWKSGCPNGLGRPGRQLPALGAGCSCPADSQDAP